MSKKTQSAFRKFKSLLEKNISRKNAIIGSVLLHLGFAAILTTIHFDKITGLPIRVHDEIEFEIIPEEHVDFEKNSNNQEFTNQEHSSQTEEFLDPSASATNGATQQNGNTTPQRDMLMMASLSTMDELRSPFNFMVQRTSADSVGAFSPVQGIAPDTKALLDALNSGLLKVDGFGRGNCPERGGGILR